MTNPNASLSPLDLSTRLVCDSVGCLIGAAESMLQSGHLTGEELEAMGTMLRVFYYRMRKVTPEQWHNGTTRDENLHRIRELMNHVRVRGDALDAF